MQQEKKQKTAKKYAPDYVPVAKRQSESARITSREPVDERLADWPFLRRKKDTPTEMEEDAADLLLVEKIMKNPKWIPLEEVKKQLDKKHGVTKVSGSSRTGRSKVSKKNS